MAVSAAPNEAPNEAVSALREALSAQVVALPDEFGDRRVKDWSGLPSAVPLALIRPRDTSEVAAALGICARYAQPVVTQGGLTGLVGGANLRGGEVALSLDRMNQIVEIDTVSATMTVQAGTPLQVVQEAASAADFYFPLDLGAARQLFYWRQSRHQRGWKSGHQVRHDARSGAGHRGRAGERCDRRWPEQDDQGQQRLRSAQLADWQ